VKAILSIFREKIDPRGIYGEKESFCNDHDMQKVLLFIKSIICKVMLRFHNAFIRNIGTTT
jgi:hypothetical protein